MEHPRHYVVCDICGDKIHQYVADDAIFNGE
jgi:hypothetical protein